MSVTSLGFPKSETATFWVGTEEGNVYAANRYDRAGSKAGLVQTTVYRGHEGPVLGMDFHPGQEGAVELGELFLTCGVDWTVKLWRTALGTKGASKGTNSTTTTATSRTAGSVVEPILSFEEADDYVYDVKWHPHHPALFGSVDGAGKFDLWNLNVDTEVPLSSPLSFCSFKNFADSFRNSGTHHLNFCSFIFFLFVYTFYDSWLEQIGVGSERGEKGSDRKC